MVAIKVVFIGNPLAGDDGIGPRLYCELSKEHNRFGSTCQLIELGVIGLDMLNYVDGDDTLVIVDAVYADHGTGEVVLFGENDLRPNLRLVSQHDFGVEQTAVLLRAYHPELTSISVIGVKVYRTQAFTDSLSYELESQVPRITDEVASMIQRIIATENDG